MRSGDISTDVALLGWVQSYLRNRLQQAHPDALVVAAWDEFYRTYDGLIRRFAYARGLRGSDLDDCVQTVWLAVASDLEDFQHPRSHPALRAWLYALVRSKGSDLVRRRRPAESLDAAREAGHEPAASEPDPALAAERQWEHALLETLVNDVCQEISKENARLLRMRCVEGREVAEVAAALGLTAEQVWYRQHRLMKKLKARASVFTGEKFGEEPIEEDDTDAV